MRRYYISIYSMILVDILYYMSSNLTLLKIDFMVMLFTHRIDNIFQSSIDKSNLSNNNNY